MPARGEVQLEPELAEVREEVLAERLAECRAPRCDNRRSRRRRPGNARSDLTSNVPSPAFFALSRTAATTCLVVRSERGLLRLPVRRAPMPCPLSQRRWPPASTHRRRDQPSRVAIRSIRRHRRVLPLARPSVAPPRLAPDDGAARSFDRPAITILPGPRPTRLYSSPPPAKLRYTLMLSASNPRGAQSMRYALFAALSAVGDASSEWPSWEQAELRRSRTTGGPIFDGKSLDGWEHVGPGKMVLEDGMHPDRGRHGPPVVHQGEVRRLRDPGRLQDGEPAGQFGRLRPDRRQAEGPLVSRSTTDTRSRSATPMTSTTAPARSTRSRRRTAGRPSPPASGTRWRSPCAGQQVIIALNGDQVNRLRLRRRRPSPSGPRTTSPSAAAADVGIHRAPEPRRCDG